MKTASICAALLAAVTFAGWTSSASAFDNRSYAFYHAGKSSDDSWDKCDDDDDDKYRKSYRKDDDHKKCKSKKPKKPKHGNNGWGNGGDDGNNGSDRGRTAYSKLDFSRR